MAIKFDELLEALDPSLDKFEEDLDSMWIIIPTERRYDDLTADDYFKFARKYGTFNNQKDCFDKIEELAPDRWDAFIPMKLEGINEAYETDIEIESKPGDPYYTGDNGVKAKPGDPYYTGGDEFLNEDFSEDNIDYIGEILSRYIRRNGWDSLFDYPALAVRDNSGNNRHFVIKSTKNSIIITDEDYKPIYSHELNSKNDLKTIFNEAAKEIIKNVKRFKIAHVNESCDKKLKEGFNNIDIINKKIIASCDPESTLIEVLNACGGNLNWTASDLGLTVDELKFAIKFYGLDQDFDSFSESLNESKYWNNKQNTEFYNDIRYKVDGAVYQIMKDIFKDLKIDKLAAQVHNLVPEYDPSWATHKRDDDNNLRLHKVRTGLSASLLDELSDKMNPGSLDRTVNNLRKY